MWKARGGQGAIFTVRLSRAPLSRPTEAPERRHPTLGDVTASSVPSLDDVRVLVVDDEPDSNEAVSSVLSSSGADVRVAGSAEDGIRQLQGWLPDVIVSDIGMPGEDGYAFIAKARAHAPTSHVPVIALTAYATTDDRIRIFSAGFNAHLVKPIDPAELVAVVASMAKIPFRTA
jgi:CheY-like chemotaxis protein